MSLPHPSSFSDQVLISSRDVGQACHEIWGAGPKCSPYNSYLTGVFPFWAGLGPGEVQQQGLSGRQEPLLCTKALGHNSAVPRTRALPRGARRCYPPVQVVLETFSFAVNSRGSLRTEIRPAPGPGLAAGSVPSALLGCPWAAPTPIPLGVSLMGFGVSLMGFVLKGRFCVRNAFSVL